MDTIINTALKSFKSIFQISRLQPVFFALLAFVFSVLYVSTGVLNGIDNKISEAKFSYINYAPSGKIVVVGLDERSSSALGSWPLTRDKYADLLNKLNSAGAAKVFFDATASNASVEAHDNKFQKSLRSLGADRVAMPKVNSFTTNDLNQVEEYVIKPAEIFSKEVTLVSADLIVEDNFKIKVIGNDLPSPTSSTINASQWLGDSSLTKNSPIGVNFGLQLSDIEKISFMDILDGNYDPKQLAGKNVIVGIADKNPVYRYAVPRFGQIDRIDLFALGAETELQQIEVKPIPQAYILLATLAFAIGLSMLLFYLDGFAGLGLMTATFLMIFFMTMRLQADFLLNLPVAFIVLTVLLTYAANLIATNSKFARLRSMIIGMVNKVDMGLANYFHSNMEAIITFDKEGVIQTVNLAAEKMFDIKSEDAVGKPLADIVPEYSDQMLKEASKHQPGRLEMVRQNEKADDKYLDLAIDGMPTDDGWLGFASIRDVTVNRLREEELKLAVELDGLTSLTNRVGLDRHFHEMFENDVELKKGFSVFLLDLDGFKTVNDTYGHQAGDDILVQVAEDLRKTVGKDDLIVRLGGDEFVIVARSANQEKQASKLAQKIVDKIGKPYTAGGIEIKIGTSIGIAFYGKDINDKYDLMKLADEAMYVAKKGKLGFKFA